MAIDEVRLSDARLEGGPVVELDLGEQPAGAPARPRTDRRERFARRVVLGPSLPRRQELRRQWLRWRVVVVAALAGAMLGGALVYVADAARQRDDAALTVALGESGGRVLTRRFGDRRVVLLSAVAVNEGRSTLTLRSVRVDGPGASTMPTWRDEDGIYPLTVEPGQTRDLPLAVAADCSAGAAEAPRVLVDLTHEDGTTDTLEVRIPALAGLWREATAGVSCSSA